MLIDEKINAAWENREMLSDPLVIASIHEVIEALDQGKLRVAEPKDGEWVVNDWIKKAINLYFPISKMETIEVGPFEVYQY